MDPIRLIRIIAVLVIASFLHAGHIEADQSSVKTSNEAGSASNSPESELEERLRRTPAVRSQAIEADVKEGVVTLSGSVDSLSSSRSAAEIATTIPGINSVVNQLIVQPPLVPDDDIVEHSVSLISEMEAADASRIQITSSEGVVEISGPIDSIMEKELIESEIAYIRGVKSINNLLEVDSRRDTNDDELTAIITELMENSTVLDGSNVEVEVKNRAVALSGSVLTPTGKATAVHLAGIPGVTAVDAAKLVIRSDEDFGKRRSERLSSITDEKIARSIKLAMNQHPLVVGAADNINVTSSAGIVTLVGKAKRFSIKKAAEEIATFTSGVQGIDNRIEIEWSDDKITDEDVVRNVKKAVTRDAYLELADIIPRSRDFHVHLYGMVDTNFEKERAGQIAGAQEGVVHVANYLTVSDSFDELSDERIADSLRRDIKLLNTDPQVQVSVEIHNGVPIFRGHVSTWFQWQSLLRMANEAGARRPHIDVTVHYRPNGIGADLYVPE
ncbi:BON domain-containing protein [Verrucomicrobiales bacterium BCK34]|nr:BON domain-containing protein [Verrucomicrobiales bacterium BCK34]